VKKSKQGKNFKGQDLTEDNLRAGALVMYKDQIYKTGNRRHRLVELRNHEGKVVELVKTGDIYLVERTDRYALVDNKTNKVFYCSKYIPFIAFWLIFLAGVLTGVILVMG
jgi:hypothetical protein